MKSKSMPLTFDLGGVLAHPPPDTVAATVRPLSFAHAPAPQLTFTIAAPPPPRMGLVRRFAVPVLEHFGVEVDADRCREARGDDPEQDQYTIPEGRNMCFAVLFSNDTGRKHEKSLLGRYGHIERSAAWVHLIGGVAFVVYAALRPSVITQEHTLPETMTTVAAAAVAFCFLSSTVYHVTSPSRRLAFWTRQLDYGAIYAGIAIGGLADYAIATRGFNNTALLSIVDLPLAALLTTLFFLGRRGLLPSEDTWQTYLGGCTASMGLMRRAHIDGTHTGTRQSTSFILAIAYLVTLPSLYSAFGSENASIIFGIQILAVAVVVTGMVVDSYYVYPDDRLAAGKGPSWAVCKRCGCIASSHAIWHGFSLLAAVQTAVSREYALSVMQ